MANSLDDYDKKCVKINISLLTTSLNHKIYENTMIEYTLLKVLMLIRQVNQESAVFDILGDW